MCRNLNPPKWGRKMEIENLIRPFWGLIFVFAAARNYTDRNMAVGLIQASSESGWRAAQAIAKPGFDPGGDIKFLTIGVSASAFKTMLAGDIKLVECNPLPASRISEAAAAVLLTREYEMMFHRGMDQQSVVEV